MPISLTRSTSVCMVLDTPKGRGVFATTKIPSGTIVDTAPVIVLPDEDWKKHVQHTFLSHYTYNWPQRNPDSTIRISQAVVLGLGSMFNHSRLKQNVGWRKDVDAGVVIYTTIREIEKEGEELLISYGDKLWFKDADHIEEPEEKPDDFFSNIDI